MNKYHNEFRGFFFADGCASIVKLNRRSKYIGKRVGLVERKYITYSARLQITQRDDNWRLIEEIQKLYGGHIVKNKPPKNGLYQSSPTITWVIEKTDKVHSLCEVLLNSAFKYRSIDSVKSVYEYCDWRLKRGLQAKYGEKDIRKIEEWRERITNSHKYQGQKVIE